MLIYPDDQTNEFLTFDHRTLQETAHPTNIGDYDKRIEALLYQLPQMVIATIELCGVRTPGLKPISTDYVKENGVWKKGDDIWLKLGNGQWVTKRDDYYQTLTKFDDLEKWKKTAYELIEKQRNERKESDLMWFIPYRGQFQEEDVERTYNEHYDRIFRALVNSTKQEEIVTQMEDIREKVCDALLERKYPKADIDECLKHVFKESSEEIYNLVEEKMPAERISNSLIYISGKKLDEISKSYAQLTVKMNDCDAKKFGIILSHR